MLRHHAVHVYLKQISVIRNQANLQSPYQHVTFTSCGRAQVWKTWQHLVATMQVSRIKPPPLFISHGEQNGCFHDNAHMYSKFRISFV